MAYKARKGDFTRIGSKNGKGLSFKNIILMQLNGLDYSYRTELDEFFNPSLKRSPHDIPSPAAFCLGRKKVKHEVFIELNANFRDSIYRNIIVKDWHGYRLIAVDGSSVHVPDTDENVEYFGGIYAASGNGQICPKARISFAYDPLNRMLIDARMAPYHTSEDELARLHLEGASPNDLNLYDRGYASYRLFRLHEDHGVHYCARLPVDLFTTLTEPFLASKCNDTVVEYAPSANALAACKKDGLSVAPVKIRLIKVVLNTGEIEVLATNVFDKRICVKSFKALYHLRWSVEEEYKRLKCRAEIEAFSGELREFVFQDFYADILRLNISAQVAMPARQKLLKAGVKDKHLHAPNMSYAFSKLTLVLETTMFSNEDKLSLLLKNLTESLCRGSEPIRPGREYPRERKPLRSGYSKPYKRAG